MKSVVAKFTCYDVEKTEEGSNAKFEAVISGSKENEDFLSTLHQDV